MHLIAISDQLQEQELIVWNDSTQNEEHNKQISCDDMDYIEMWIITLIIDKSGILDPYILCHILVVEHVF